MVNEIELNPSLYRPQDFKIEKGVKMLNCGSYGVIPTSVHANRVAWLEKIDSHSDTWICDKRVELLEESIIPLAEYIGSPAKDTVFVSNTTQGFVHVLETMGLGPGDLIVYNSSTYGAIQMLVEQLRDNKGIELLKLDYNAEDDDSLIEYYKTEFDNLEKSGKTPKLAIIDAIISVPALILPFEKLTKLIQSYGTQVFIDGAHAYGQIKLNIDSFKPDYFVTNIHKWGYAPRGTALLYISPQHQNNIRNFVTTFGCESDSLRMKFNWFGTIDFSGWFSAPESLEYRKKIGDDEIYVYNHNLALLAGNYIADLLNTKVLGSPSQVGFMSNVELPLNEPYSFDLQFKIEQYILKEYGLRLKLFHFKDKWYIRLSAQLNLCLEDFKLAGKALKQTLELNLDEL